MISEKSFPNATPSTTNLTWTELGSSPSLRFESSVINRLSNGKVLKGSASTKRYSKIQSLTQKKNTLPLHYKEKLIDALWKIIIFYTENRTKGMIHGAEKTQTFKPYSMWRI